MKSVLFYKFESCSIYFDIRDIDILVIEIVPPEVEWEC